jgi:hypothetical protein
MKMEYTAMVRRGWPNEGAVEAAEVIKTGVTLVNGDWVCKQADGTVDKASATALNNVFSGLVIAGNGDNAITVGSTSYAGTNSNANTNKAVVLWSGFIVDVSNFDATPTYAPGNAVMTVSGKLTLWTTGNPVAGHVLAVVPGSATETARLQVLVK